MKKLFFTNPIFCLYMMQEFGIKVECEGYNSGYEAFDFYRESQFWRYLQEIIEDLKEGKVDPRKIYVAPESEHIFEPKEKDMLNGGSFVFSLGGELKAFNMEGARLIGSNEKIIMRDNKQFFPAEVEDDK